MAVVSVTELPRRPGDVNGESSTADRNWRILVDSKSDSSQTIKGSLPAYLSPHPDNAYMTCRSLRIQEVPGSWQYWEATAKYSSEPLSQREKERQESNPLARPPKIRWNTRDEVEVAFVDLDGNALVNSAGDYFDPPPERIVGNWTATVEVNVAEVPAAIRSYKNAVNDAPITIDGIPFDEGTVRIAGIAIGEELEENGVTYRVLGITYEDKEDHPVNSSQVLNPATGGGATPDPWDDVILDQGMRRKKLGSGSGTGTGTGGDDDGKSPVVQIEDADSNFVNSPVMLDGTGLPLTDPSPTTAKYFRFRQKRRISFSGLPGVT